MSNKSKYQYLPPYIGNTYIISNYEINLIFLELSSYNETSTCFDYSSINPEDYYICNNNSNHEYEVKDKKQSDIILLDKIFLIKNLFGEHPVIRNMLMINMVVYCLIFLCLAKFQ